ncbi:type II toxin-antitoxin system VapC family toxin [Azospirillum sp. B2RO_4]|uniref:type II toxin-antitoxin system VapC family toxin n=1 Tax=Azospirillum sp. B2RO_4 TaxID=3027796 RepID=UPI003DA9301E
MKLLLDSHVLLWVLDVPERLPPLVHDLVSDPTVTVLVSIASLWELRIKALNGKLEAPDDLSGLALASGFSLLPIDVRHIGQLEKLPNHHRDPFDRMLIAQTQADGLTLVSADRTIRLYDVPVLWS